ncbi:unnamed protein product, partial [Cladocopium goreaui]
LNLNHCSRFRKPSQMSTWVSETSVSETLPSPFARSSLPCTWRTPSSMVALCE